jgi:hypothetical protein
MKEEAPAAAAEEPAAEEPATEEKAAAAEETAYDARSLLLPVIQQTVLLMSHDYFDQFTWDQDEIFPDYLDLAFGLESTQYREGEGTVVESNVLQTGIPFTLEKALLSTNPDGSQWWQIIQTLYDLPISYEVLVSEYKTLMSLRYYNPYTEAWHETVPPMARYYAEGLEELGPEEFEAWVEKRRADRLEQEFGWLFTDPIVVEVEPVEVGAGVLEAVHISDSTEEGAVDYWLTPDVPGGIAKIEYRGDDSELIYSIEMAKITRGNTSRVDQRMLVSDDLLEERISEGSPEAPVELVAGVSHFGSVGADGTSYYRVRVSRRADVSIEVSELSGGAELIYFGTDESYQDWRVSSQGFSPDVSDYYVDPGTEIHFTVVEADEESEDGLTYTILVEEDVFLSDTGILMRGEIYSEAEELKPGEPHERTYGTAGLRYFKTRVQKGPNVRIEGTGLSDFAELVWFGTDGGSYGSGVSHGGRGNKKIEVFDVASGTVCLYYVVADMEMLLPEESFSISVEEFGE